MQSRRTFLIAAAPAAALAVSTASAHSSASAEERARRAWQQFSAAMRELTTEADGWVIVGAGERRGSGAWLNLSRIDYEHDSNPCLPSLVVERHRKIKL